MTKGMTKDRKMQFLYHFTVRGEGKTGIRFDRPSASDIENLNFKIGGKY